MLFPIKKLIEGRGEPLCVKKENTLKDALTLMVERDFSQLPVIDDQGRLSGIISETSIISTYYHTGNAVSLLDLSVDHCQTKAVTLTPEQDIFEALDALKNVYAIVIVEDQKPVGILTDFDTTHFFRDLSEGLVMVEDIEVTLRQYIEQIYTDEHSLKAALIKALGTDRRDPSQPYRKYEEMTLGNYLYFITSDSAWEKFEPYLQPKAFFFQMMDQVREIRNQLAHFRGRLEPIQLNALIRARDWLETRPRVQAADREPRQTVRVSERERATQKSPDKYAPLTAWLEKQGRRAKNIEMSLKDLEALIGDSLPETARKHRSWWSNDFHTNPQALAWLRAGWMVDDIDLSKGTVGFHPTDYARMMLFFSDVLERFKKARPGVTQAEKTAPQNWFSFGGGKTGFVFGWAFPQGPVFRTELYMDTGNKRANKFYFDYLHQRKEHIEEKIGEELDWQRLDDKKASRICISIKGKVTDSEDKLEKMKQWGASMMVKFVDTLQPMIRELPDYEE